MGNCGQTARAGHRWRTLLTLLCLLLVVVAGTIQVAHVHADGALTHPDCSLCAALHITAQVADDPVPAAAVAVVTVLEAMQKDIFPAALATFALFTRPPPVDIVPA